MKSHAVLFGSRDWDRFADIEIADDRISNTRENFQGPIDFLVGVVEMRR